MTRPMRPLLPALLLLLPLAACGDAESPADDPAAAATPAPTGSAPRSADPRVAELRAALEDGQVGAARALLDQAGAAAGYERDLLEARLRFLEGDQIGWMKSVERARRADPTDPRPYATAAELYAALGRTQAASDEIERGIEAAGRTPELERALGVVAISTPGGAVQGLARLESARKRDPELPFCDFVLAEAHRVVAAEKLRDGDPDAAVRHAEASLAARPGDVETRRLLGDSLLGSGRVGRATEVYDALVAEGVPCTVEAAAAHRAAATAALVTGDEALQLKHLLAARELGMTDDELGFGAELLQRAAQAELDAGLAAKRRAAALASALGDDVEPELAAELAADRDAELLKAEEHFHEALRLDPRSYAAAYQQSAARFHRGDFRAAAEGWEQLLADARARGVSQPGPLHLDIATAWARAGEPDRARAALDAYLAESPEGEWADRTRELRASLP